MKRKTSGDAHYFAFGAKDWRSSESVGLMSLAEKGAFIDLLSIAWLSSDEPCSIPADDAEIAALLRIPEVEWKRIAPRVLAEFDETTKGGRLRNQRLWNEWKRMLSARRQMAKGGRTSALRRRDEHGRLLPSTHPGPDQAPTKHLGKVPSGNQNQNQNQSTTTTAKTTTTAPKQPARAHASWLDPVARSYETRKGAGTFAWAKFGKILKPLQEAGHAGEEIALRLGRYLDWLDDPKYLSLSKFRETFGDYASEEPAAFRELAGYPDVVDAFGVFTAYGERVTRPTLRLA